MEPRITPITLIEKFKKSVASARPGCAKQAGVKSVVTNFHGQLEDYAYPVELVAKAMQDLPKVPER